MDALSQDYEIGWPIFKTLGDHVFNTNLIDLSSSDSGWGSGYINPMFEFKFLWMQI
jgi:hypothetical protein